MISHLTGTVIDRGERSIIIDVSGVGYKVFVTTGVMEKLNEGSKVSIWTYLAVREDAHTLYGFNEKEGLEFFELLISISGIGPKSALGILNVSSPDAIRNAVSSGDTSHLTKVSGIGKKSAEKIVLELQDKLGSLSQGNEASGLKEKSEALEALVSLGYSLQDARSALKEISGTATTTNELVREALKKLGS